MCIRDRDFAYCLNQLNQNTVRVFGSQEIDNDVTCPFYRFCFQHFKTFFDQFFRAGFNVVYFKSYMSDTALAVIELCQYPFFGNDKFNGTFFFAVFCEYQVCRLCIYKSCVIHFQTCLLYTSRCV